MSQAPANLIALVTQGLASNPSGVAAATKRDGRWIETSVKDFEAAAEHLALGLYEIGVRRGDRVALHSENSAEWLIADRAILSLGAVNVPIYTTQPADQIEFILQDSGSVVYIVSTAALYAPVAERLPRVPGLKATIGIRGSHAADVLGWDEVIESGRALWTVKPGLLPSWRVRVSADDLATLIYTSGTTGTPKGVMLTHGNLVSNVLASLDRMPWDVDANRGQRILSYLPLSHVFERMLSYLYLHMGYPVWYVESFEQILEDLQTVKPAHFSSVPRLLEKVHAGINNKVTQLSGAQRAILKWGLELANRFDVERPLGVSERVQYALADALVYRKLRALFGGNLQAITSGGAALSPQVMNFVNAIGIFCGQGYGLTETSPVITVYKRGELRAGSVGTPIEGVEVKIADDGEILCRGPNVMQGYWNNPEATAEAINAEGWFHTGDVGHLDAQGHLFITDRKKELMKLSTGKYIAPQPIERRMAASPFVEQAVVIGNERHFCSALIVINRPAVAAHFADRGEVLREGVSTEHPKVQALFAELMTTVNEGLPAWEQVKKFTLLDQPWSIEGGELTPKMSVKRRVVHEKYAGAIQSMYG